MQTTKLDFEGNHRGTQLFVLIHGWEHSATNLADLTVTVRDAFRDADILLPSYPARTWSNGNMAEISDTCVGEIDDAWKAHKDGGY